MREVKFYYQDCTTCKLGKTWPEIQDCAKKMKISIEKVRYDAPGAKEVILAAYARGVTVPFFTDGTKYANSLADFTETTTKKSKAKDNGADSGN